MSSSARTSSHRSVTRDEGSVLSTTGLRPTASSLSYSKNPTNPASKPSPVSKPFYEVMDPSPVRDNNNNNSRQAGVDADHHRSVLSTMFPSSTTDAAAPQEINLDLSYLSDNNASNGRNNNNDDMYPSSEKRVSSMKRSTSDFDRRSAYSVLTTGDDEDEHEEYVDNSGDINNNRNGAAVAVGYSPDDKRGGMPSSYANYTTTGNGYATTGINNSSQQQQGSKNEGGWKRDLTPPSSFTNLTPTYETYSRSLSSAPKPTTMYATNDSSTPKTRSLAASSSRRSVSPNNNKDENPAFVAPSSSSSSRGKQQKGKSTTPTTVLSQKTAATPLPKPKKGDGNEVGVFGTMAYQPLLLALNNTSSTSSPAAVSKPKHIPETDNIIIAPHHFTTGTANQSSSTASTTTTTTVRMMCLSALETKGENIAQHGDEVNDEDDDDDTLVEDLLVDTVSDKLLLPPGLLQQRHEEGRRQQRCNGKGRGNGDMEEEEEESEMSSCDRSTSTYDSSDDEHAEEYSGSNTPPPTSSSVVGRFLQRRKRKSEAHRLKGIERDLKDVTIDVVLKGVVVEPTSLASNRKHSSQPPITSSSPTVILRVNTTFWALLCMLQLKRDQQATATTTATTTHHDKSHSHRKGSVVSVGRLSASLAPASLPVKSTARTHGFTSRLADMASRAKLAARLQHEKQLQDTLEEDARALEQLRWNRATSPSRQRNLAVASNTTIPSSPQHTRNNGPLLRPPSLPREEMSSPSGEQERKDAQLREMRSKLDRSRQLIYNNLANTSAAEVDDDDNEDRSSPSICEIIMDDDEEEGEDESSSDHHGHSARVSKAPISIIGHPHHSPKPATHSSSWLHNSTKRYPTLISLELFEAPITTTSSSRKLLSSSSSKRRASSSHTNDDIDDNEERAFWEKYRCPVWEEATQIWNSYIFRYSAANRDNLRNPANPQKSLDDVVTTHTSHHSSDSHHHTSASPQSQRRRSSGGGGGASEVGVDTAWLVVQDLLQEQTRLRETIVIQTDADSSPHKHKSSQHSHRSRADENDDTRRLQAADESFFNGHGDNYDQKQPNHQSQDTSVAAGIGGGGGYRRGYWSYFMEEFRDRERLRREIENL